MSSDFYSFTCVYCGHVTNGYLTGVSPYGRVKCPACGKYYKCYSVKCRFCGKAFTPKSRFQEEIKKCPNCCKNRVNTPIVSVTFMEIKL